VSAAKRAPRGTKLQLTPESVGRINIHESGFLDGRLFGDVEMPPAAGVYNIEFCASTGEVRLVPLGPGRELIALSELGLPVTPETKAECPACHGSGSWEYGAFASLPCLVCNGKRVVNALVSALYTRLKVR
jgi:hypothetical protein